MNKKKIISDILLNIVATIIPLAILQLIIYPRIANNLGDTKYGEIIAIVSLFSLFSTSFGNVLNNVRLLQNSTYDDNSIEGDFNLLLIYCLIINSFIVTIGTFLYEGKHTLFSFISVLIIAGLYLTNEYLIVEFRIKLNYRAILLNNIFLVIGYIIGFLIFLVTDEWQYIYLVGFSFNLLYILRNTRLFRERLARTSLFNDTLHKSLILFCANFLRTALVYADKLLLYPILGAEAVAVYYAATIIGKMFSLGINPISGVLLSYLMKIEKIKTKSINIAFLLIGLFGGISYFVSIFVSKPILHLLYPSWADKSIELIYVTTAYAIIEVISTVINPFILRFNSINWQIFISFINIFVYVVGALFFYSIYGLLGFCVGLLMAGVIKLLLMLLIFVKGQQSIQSD